MTVTATATLGRDRPVSRTLRRRPTLTGAIIWAVAACFLLVLAGILASVVVESFATSWPGGWWPKGLTAEQYGTAWNNNGVSSALAATFEVGLSVIAISVVLGVPAAYALTRRPFRGKSVVVVMLLLPVMLPPLSYAIQLSALLYKIGLGGTLAGVILSNLVPALPFVILLTMPFVEQISPELESAARVFGANTFQMYARVLFPLLLPGILAAAILSLVRVFGAFELTFFVSGPSSQTLVVALFGAAANPGTTSPTLIAAIAVIYMASSLFVLSIALRFVNPTQVISRRRG